MAERAIAARIVYYLQFELEPKPGSAGIVQLIAWLDADGNSPTCWHPQRGKRVVDLRPGGWLRHSTGMWKIRAIGAYRQHFLDEAGLAERDRGEGGFVVRCREQGV